VFLTLVVLMIKRVLLVQPRHVFSNTFRDGAEFHVTAGGAQFGEIGLSEALVTAFQVLWERNVLNFTFPVMFDYRFSYVLEWFGFAGTAVEDAGFVWVVHKPQYHFGDIFHVDEVTRLTAIREAVTTFEQFDVFTFQHLIVQVERHAGHAAFMLLTRAIDVEIF